MIFEAVAVPSEVIPKLYLGNYSASRNRDFLASHNVTHILTVAGEIEPEYPAEFVYKIVDIDDWHEEDIAKHFKNCFDFIDQGIQSGGVLVHCLAGISRSPAIVTAYLMQKHSMALQEALDAVKSKRPIISPNRGFIVQLQEFEKRTTTVTNDARSAAFA
jgi:protein-tyrosine phosphatase